jgi:hypothetical protein
LWRIRPSNRQTEWHARPASSASIGARVCLVISN